MTESIKYIAVAAAPSKSTLRTRSFSRKNLNTTCFQPSLVDSHPVALKDFLGFRLGIRIVNERYLVSLFGLQFVGGNIALSFMLLIIWPRTNTVAAAQDKPANSRRAWAPSAIRYSNRKSGHHNVSPHNPQVPLQSLGR